MLSQITWSDAMLGLSPQTFCNLPKQSHHLGASAKHIIMGAGTEEADAFAIFPRYKYVSRPLCTLTDAHLR